MSMQDFWENWAQNDSWASLYEGKPNLRTYNFITRRRAVAKLLSDEGKLPRILDVGCGAGDYVVLADEHDGSYHGIDFSESMIREGREVHSKTPHRDNLIVGSGNCLPYEDNTFDCGIGIGYIEYFPDPDIPLGEIRRVLKPGGLMVIQAYKWDLWGRFGKNITQPIRKHVFRQKLIRDRMPDDFVDMRYGKTDLDGIMKRNGFTLRSSTHNHFVTMPPFIKRRMIGTHVRVSEWMDRTAPDFWGFLAVNYIGKYQLTEG